jgi:stearoyl-CoA desaturase (delta-9 desaturase)
MKIDMTDLKADSVVMFQKRHYYKLAFLWTFIIPTLTGLIISDKWFFSLLFLGFGKYIFTLNATW